MPPAEVEVTDDLVLDLVKGQHPDLLADVELAANGWDNAIYRLGDQLAVRLPRRAIGAELLLNEQRWLPVLRPYLRLPAPVPLRTGHPTPDFPWPWSITRWFEGRPLARVALPLRNGCAGPLGQFFAGLHRPAAQGAPANPLRGVALSERTAGVQRQLQLGIVEDPNRIWLLWERLAAIPGWSRRPSWLHGDPHPGNILIAQGRVAAVLDFGDITAGDPATDLALGWLGFDAAGREQFARAYVAEHGSDDHTWQRARGWALCLGLALLANSDDDATLRAVGRHAVDQACAEP